MIEEIVTSKFIEVRAATVRTASLRKVAKLTDELSIFSSSRKQMKSLMSLPRLEVLRVPCSKMFCL